MVLQARYFFEMGNRVASQGDAIFVFFAVKRPPRRSQQSRPARGAPDARTPEAFVASASAQEKKFIQEDSTVARAALRSLQARSSR
jgi:hypothetical protein